MNELTINLGKKIRELRKLKGLTIVKLASKLKLSNSFISQLERGSINPSITLLKSISDEFNIPIQELLEDMGSKNSFIPRIITEKERKVITFEGGVYASLLNHYLNWDYEFVLNKYPPGSCTGKLKYTHEGEECGYVLEGEIIVEINNESYHLKAGDSIVFHSDIPHRTINKTKKNARAVWINSKAWAFSTKYQRFKYDINRKEKENG
ncbi:MAG: cupin domain-containing protein [Atribacterota bacterium]|nr:cupin domain-containing protein [Atribacterota bacterium]